MAVDTYALTSLANLKAFMKPAPTDEDALLEKLIDRASDVIEQLCDRKLMSRSHTDWLDGTGSPHLLLPHYPVTAVGRVCIGERDVMSLKNTSTDMAYATASNNGTNVTLVVVGGTNESSTNFAIATYTTVTLLVAQINATGNGWTAGILNSADSHPTSDLRTITARGVTDSPIYVTVPEEPVESYTWDQDSGRLYLAGGWPAGAGNIYAAYTGGYSTVPDDLELACIEIAAKLYKERERDANMQSEHLGDYGYTLRSEVEQSGYFQRLLAPYRRMVA